MMKQLEPTPLTRGIARQIADRYLLSERMSRARRTLAKGRLKRLLRSHEEETVAWREVRKRDSLDELLACLAVLHIGGLDEPALLEDLKLPVKDLLTLLEQPDVTHYVEKTYSYAPLILFREAHQKGGSPHYLERLAGERQEMGWRSVFDRFLVLDASFNAPGPMDNLLGLLDGYTIGGLDLGDLAGAFHVERRMRSLVGKKAGRALLEGLQDFITFSDELDDLLTASKRYPLFAGLVWLHYGYWFGAGGERIRIVAEWVTGIAMQIEARGDVLGRDAAQTGPHLRGVMDRLTDLDLYPADILRTCAEPLGRWLTNVGTQRSVTDRA